MGVALLGIARDRLLQCGDRLIWLVGGGKRDAEPAMGGGEVGLDGDRTAQRLGRRQGLAAIQESEAEIVAGEGVVGFEGRRPAHGIQRFGEPARFSQLSRACEVRGGESTTFRHGDDL